MEQLISSTDKLTKEIDALAIKVDALQGRLDVYSAIPVKTVAFGAGWYGWVSRLLIGFIILMQLLIGGLIAHRLGPEGYDRSQARANWVAFCLEVHKYHPDFLCPSISFENTKPDNDADDK